MKASRDQLTSAAHAVALEASVNAGRIPAAILNLDNAEGHLRASGGQGGSGGDMPDPTFAAVDKPDQAHTDRQRIERIITQQLDLSKELSALLASWAPDEQQQAAMRGVKLNNDDLWCPNHRRHGIDEPRAPDRDLCRFCDDFAREHKPYARKHLNGEQVLPNRWLLDTRSRRKLNSADITKALTDIVAERRVARTQARKDRIAG